MKDDVDYKKLWFELCEEKKQLQIDNHMLEKDSKYWRKRFESLEEIHSELNQKNWNKGGKVIKELKESEECNCNACTLCEYNANKQSDALHENDGVDNGK